MKDEDFLLNFISLQEKCVILEVRVSILEDLLFNKTNSLGLSKEEYVSKCNDAIKIINETLQENLLKSDKVKKVLDKINNKDADKEKEGA
jgi:hypothetical protein